MKAEGAGKLESLRVSAAWRLRVKTGRVLALLKLCSTNQKPSQNIHSLVKKELMDAFAAEVREINERVIELSRSYAIFWVFISSYKRYSKVIDDHRDFFDAIASSLLQGFCVITYQLFDKRADVKSLPRILNYVASFDPALEQRLRMNIDAQTPLLERFFSYRHKIYAHRDKAKSPWQVFGSMPKIRLKREMKTIVGLSRDTICALPGVSGVRKKATMSQAIRLRENHARWDAKEILKALEKSCA